MRWFFRFIILFLILAPIGLIAAAVMCIESSPLVTAKTRLSPVNIANAKRLLREHDPRKLRNNEVKTFTISEQELTLVANHLINGVSSGGAVVKINAGELVFTATLDLSKVLPGEYLNVEAIVSERAGTPRFEQLVIGRLVLPRMIIAPIAVSIVEYLYRESGVLNANEVIQAIEIRPHRLDITYQWKTEIVDAIRDRLMSIADRQKLRIYNSFLAAELDRPGSTVTFVKLVESLFAHARARSMQGQSVAENRALILVLAAYVNGRSLKSLTPEATNWVIPKRVSLRIHGRKDLVNHFTTSAALAVTGGSEVANAIGLYKEIDDADGGSGFSFKDLAADMAGTRFGQLAVENDSAASRLQRAIGEGIDDLMLIPDVSSLPENLSKAEFKHRFGGIEGREYLSVLKAIDQRIAHAVLYR